MLLLKIDDDTIKKIIENHEESMIFSVLCFKENVLEVIRYLESIHVEVLDELLINRLELFLLPKRKIQERFEKYNIQVLVELINEDINVLNNV